MWPALEAMAHTASYDATIMTGHMSGSPLPPQWAEWVTIPTLVMDGENSAPWQHRSVRALADLPPHARRETFPGADHGVAPESPGSGAARILRRSVTGRSVTGRSVPIRGVTVRC
jgi:pimeloyl-ACP methyl ester carboxylesterase